MRYDKDTMRRASIMAKEQHRGDGLQPMLEQCLNRIEELEAEVDILDGFPEGSSDEAPPDPPDDSRGAGDHGGDDGLEELTTDADRPIVPEDG